ncbi:hypothetical protein M3202_19695 [Alkalihalobacillus oceani]|uniref:Uncharacterized protein n=1 Tax=Halalkalibacter oceani TaxID=1653776 RepID=A0A9X2IQW2_9BACI|nr:hypothetical protein [Halalkalibacter oceani]MCM3716271.1 hypothetical protein [Halalkalibacter oceani]
MIEFNSPFSAFHEWNINWQFIPSSQEARKNCIYHEREYEGRVLEALSKVGVMGAVQLSSLYLKKDKKKLKDMRRKGLILRHDLKRNNDVIPVYTIGLEGAMRLRSNQFINYWFHWSEYDLLQRLTFVRFIQKLSQTMDEFSFDTTHPPFIGKIKIKDRLFQVLVIRNNEDEVLDYFNNHTFSEPLFVIAEHEVYLNKLNSFWPHIKVRMTLDADLHYKVPLSEMFYIFDKGKWEKEYLKRQEINKKRAASQ